MSGTTGDHSMNGNIATHTWVAEGFERERALDRVAINLPASWEIEDVRG